METTKCHCTNCGEEMDVNADFCSKCGLSRKANKIFCQNCGTSVTEEQDFCMECGTKLSKALDAREKEDLRKISVQDSDKSSDQKTKKKFRFIWFLIIIPVLATIAVALFFFLPKSLTDTSPKAEIKISLSGSYSHTETFTAPYPDRKVVQKTIYTFEKESYSRKYECFEAGELTESSVLEGTYEIDKDTIELISDSTGKDKAKLSEDKKSFKMFEMTFEKEEENGKEDL